MKKILVLSFYYQPDLCAGSFRCKAFVDELAKLEAHIHVVTTAPNRYESYKVDADKFNMSNNITINRINIPNHKSGMIDQIISFYSFYKGAKLIVSKNEYDIVFATSSRLFTAFLGATISRKKRIPLYLDIRDLFVDTISDIFSSKIAFIMRPILSLIEKYSFTSAKKINLVSKGFLPYFEEHYADIPLSFYTNGIDKEFIQASRTYHMSWTPKSIINVLYAGNIGEGQGLHRIIPQMADRLKKRIHFKIIGAGGLSEKLRDNISELGLNNVDLVPPMGRESLIEEYIKTDVLFLHLNDYDAFQKVLPSKFFEYGSMNKPILAGVSGYSKEFVKSEISDCFVFSPTNLEDAVEKFESINYSIKPRDEFIKKFDRRMIMNEMAKDVYGIC